MAKTNPAHVARDKRKKHIRKKLRGTAERPRLCVFRSAKHIYCQIIDDERGHTVAAASSLEKAFDAEKSGANKDGAKFVGKLIAERAKAANVTQVVFDRNGFLYHGRLAALADAAREAGLSF
jgi:large subunit ribosomal protein L18